MNCKQGDLAVVVKSHAGNEGKIVRCIRLSNFDGLTLPDGSIIFGQVWETDCVSPTFSGKAHPFFLDKYLRPIRDPGDSAVDEMVQRLGTPFEKSLRDHEREMAEFAKSLPRVKESVDGKGGRT